MGTESIRAKAAGFVIKYYYYDEELPEDLFFASVSEDLRSNTPEITMSFQEFMDLLKE